MCSGCTNSIASNPNSMLKADYHKVLGQRDQRGEKNHQWKGGVSHDSRGYVLLSRALLSDEDLALMVNRAKGAVYKHHLVAAQALGRPLLKGEEVHHINGDRTDNRPENLKVFASRSEHHRAIHVEQCPNCGYHLRQ